MQATTLLTTKPDGIRGTSLAAFGWGTWFDLRTGIPRPVAPALPRAGIHDPAKRSRVEDRRLETSPPDQILNGWGGARAPRTTLEI